MKLYTNIADKKLKEITKTRKELSGFARAKLLSDRTGFYVYDFYILSSQNEFGFTQMSINDVSKFFTRLIKKGIDTNDFIVWWHTHPYGIAKFSLHDEITIETILDDSDYFISIVFNHRLECSGRINIFKPLKMCIDTEVVFCDESLVPRDIDDMLKNIGIDRTKRKAIFRDDIQREKLEKLLKQIRHSDQISHTPMFSFFKDEDLLNGIIAGEILNECKGE